jgi:hypothetical protein
MRIVVADGQAVQLVLDANEEEVRRTIDLEQHFVVLPALGQIYQETVHKYEGQVAGQVTTAYNSSVEPAMSRENGLLDPERVGV